MRVDPHFVLQSRTLRYAIASLGYSGCCLRAPLNAYRLSTQPIEETPQYEHLLQILEMMHADQTLLFSSDFPHWDNDDPVVALRRVPEPLKSRIMFENAAELYGFTVED